MKLNIVADKHLPFVEAAFAALGDLRAVDTAALTPEIVKDADVLIVRSPTTVDRNLLEGSNVRFVGTATIGTDHVDLEYLASSGIAFASAPGSNANSVKEYVVAALLSLSAKHSFALKDSSIGIVGVGHVGSKVRDAAAALGMRVLLNDPPLARKTGDKRYAALNELMDADIVTLHVPLTRNGVDATYHLFDEPRLRLLRPGAILINTSRGGVIDTSALTNVMKGKHLRACALDVWEHEPNIDAGLLEVAALGTPHIAGYSLEGKSNAVKMIREALCKHFNLAWARDDAAEMKELGRTEIRIPEEMSDTPEILRYVVGQCYDIVHDDAQLRRMLELPAEARGAHFKNLRATYRTRREFSNATVWIPGRHIPLADVLLKLGFNCKLIPGAQAGTSERRATPTKKELLK